MDFGMFTDFHVRKGMTQAEAFEVDPEIRTGS